MKSFAWRSWVFVFITTFPLLAAAQTAQDFIKEGDAKGVAGDMKGCLAAYSRAIAIDPKSTEAWIARGYAKESIRDTTGAFADYEQAHTVDPTSPVPLQYSSKLKCRTGDIQGALADASRGIELEPKYDPLYLVRGDIYYTTGKYDDALTDYRKALELKPKNPGALYDIAKALVAKKDFVGAEETATELIEIAPKSSDAYFLRSSIRTLAGDTDGAMADINEVIRLYPNLVSGYGRRALLEAVSGDSAAAIADANRCVKLNPKAVIGYYTRMECLVILGKYEQALADLRTVVGISPSLSKNCDTAMLIWLLSARVEGMDTANKALQWDSDPDKQNFYSDTALYFAGNLNEKDYIAAIKGIKPTGETKRCEALFYIGMKYTALGEKARASDAFRRCIVADNGALDNFALMAKTELARLENGDTQPAQPQNAPVAQESAPAESNPAQIPPAAPTPAESGRMDAASMARAGFGKTIAEVEAIYGNPVKMQKSDDPDAVSRDYNFHGIHISIIYWKNKVAEESFEKPDKSLFEQQDFDALMTIFSGGAKWVFHDTNTDYGTVTWKRSDDAAYVSYLKKQGPLPYSPDNVGTLTFYTVTFMEYSSKQKLMFDDADAEQPSASAENNTTSAAPSDDTPVVATQAGFGKTIAEVETYYGKPVKKTATDNPVVEIREYDFKGTHVTVDYWRGKVASVVLNKTTASYFTDPEIEAIKFAYSDGATWKEKPLYLEAGKPAVGLDLTRSDKGAYGSMMVDTGDYTFTTAAYADYKSRHKVTPAGTGDTPEQTAPKSGATPVAALVASASKKFESGDSRGAIADLDKAIQLDPTTPGAYSQRGILKAMQGRTKEALVDLNKAIQLNPNDEQAKAYRTTLGGGPLPASAETTSSSAPAQPGGDAPSPQRIVQEGAVGNYDAAIADVNRLVAAKPEISEVYLFRANCFMAAGRWAEAVPDLQKYIKMTGDSRPAFSTTSILICITRRMAGGAYKENADRDLLAAVKSGKMLPYDVDAANYMLARTKPESYIPQTGMPDTPAEAKAWLDAWYYIGMNRIFNGDKENGIQALRTCDNALDSQATGVAHMIIQGELRRLATAGSAQPQAASAPATAKPVDETVNAAAIPVPDEAEKFMEDSRKQCLAGNYSVAIADADRVVKAAPRSADAYSNRAICFIAAGKWAAAVPDLVQSIKLPEGEMEDPPTLYLYLYIAGIAAGGQNATMARAELLAAVNAGKITGHDLEAATYFLDAAGHANFTPASETPIAAEGGLPWIDAWYYTGLYCTALGDKDGAIHALHIIEPIVDGGPTSQGVIVNGILERFGAKTHAQRGFYKKIVP